MTVEATARALLANGSLSLGDPGGGHTADRHIALFEIARRHPVSVARLVEAHTDAVSILHQAERAPANGMLYGVWASAGASNDVRLFAAGEELSRALVMTGTKPFASGRGLLDRALVTVSDARHPSDETGTAAGVLLVDVDLAGAQDDADSSWATPALRESATGPVSFVAQRIVPGDIVGPPGWYLDRPGFWHGACGPAACWAGAAAGLVDAARELVDDDPHRCAHLGALVSCAWMFEAMLVAAGDQIDRAPGDVMNARVRALSLRHRVERGVAEVLDRFSQALGPRPFVGDEVLNQRFLDTHLYARQHHAERDLAVLGAGRNPFATDLATLDGGPDG